VEIPIDPAAPWSRAVIRGDLNDTVEKMARMALTAMCERHLVDTDHVVPDPVLGGARVALAPRGIL
jgi:hypothetical protein